MKSFEIGPGLTCDLNKLIDSRLLIQANSGGGKSWCIRRILEQTHGHVQHLVIDPEGEFASLRERYDYIHAAKAGADTAADPRSAGLLAERLLELKVSAILDIYELLPRDRVQFVKLFLQALVNAPKALWHPALVVVDEAHMYCPEQGDADSADAVKALATLGRKRGFCAVLATQRLSKLHKDAAAECNNKLIGRTGLDVDVKRAAAELGLNEKQARPLLRQLHPGAFYGYGPAFEGTTDDFGVIVAQVGPVKTTHPKAGGHRKFEAPPPTDAIKKLLPNLSDLPAEAEQRERSLADLKRELTETKRALTLARKEQPAPKAETKVVEKFVLKDGQLARIEKAIDKIGGAAVSLQQAAHGLTNLGTELIQAVAKTRTPLPNTHATKQRVMAPTGAPTRQPSRLASTPGRGAVPAATASRPAPRVSPVDSNGNLTPARQKILNALAFFEGVGIEQVDKVQLALMAGVPPTSGGYKNNLGALRSEGFIDYPTPGDVALTDVGRGAAVTDGVPQTTKELHAMLCTKLPPAKWRIVEELIAVYPQSLDKVELAERCGVPETSGGYKNNLGSLRSLGIIDYPQPGTVAAQPMLFLEER